MTREYSPSIHHPQPHALFDKNFFAKKGIVGPIEHHPVKIPQVGAGIEKTPDQHPRAVPSRPDIECGIRKFPLRHFFRLECGVIEPV